MGDSGLDVPLLVLYFVCSNLAQGILVSMMDRKLVGLTFLFKLGSVKDFTKFFVVR